MNQLELILFIIALFILFIAGLYYNFRLGKVFIKDEVRYIKIYHAMLIVGIVIMCSILIVYLVRKVI